MFALSDRSRRNLLGVHPDLVPIVEHAIHITRVDFTVIEGVRSIERQQKLVRSGASRTMNSRHLTGHAVDLGAWVDGQIDWSWPLYYQIADAMKCAAKKLDTPLEWGGDWKRFKDGPHFQLPWASYPLEITREAG
ncbi:MAG: hypothetical protein CSB48_02880 [Proteobacteria bacterium]|nr:MAG: hypothetical protein CSB48_02880 [Pseudomonadota bacterium]